jgi:hypothetical protein
MAAAVEALGLVDAFKSAGRPLQHKFTWNSSVNRWGDAAAAAAPSPAPAAV